MAGLKFFDIHIRSGPAIDFHAHAIPSMPSAENRDLQRAAGFQQALEAGHDGRPSLRDAVRILLPSAKPVVRQRQLHELAMRLKVENDPGWLFVPAFRR